MLRYELDRLGWYDFEHLIQALLKAKLGVGVEAWGGPSGDLGRDAYFQGKIKYPSNISTKGSFVFQCKFVEGANAAGSKPEPYVVAAVQKECARIRARLKPSGPDARPQWANVPDHYSLFTNAHLGKDIRPNIEGLIRSVLPDAGIHIHDGPDICAWLDNAATVVRVFPQVLGLRDLASLISQWANPELIKRSEAAISQAKDVAKVFVSTSAYERALKVLSKHHFVILEGPPEMGKTAIGRMIALRALAQGWEALECRKPENILALHRQDSKQIYVADDFFGRTEYDPTRVSAWQDDLPHVLRLLDRSHLLVLTTRAHLLNLAKATLDVAGYGKRFPTLGEVVVNAAHLSVSEKARMLYRHAKAAKLPIAVVAWLRQRARHVVHDPHFTPERIRRLTEEVLTDKRNENLNELQIQALIKRSLVDPTVGMTASFRRLPEPHKWLMFALLEMDQVYATDQEKELASRYARLCPLECQEPYARVKAELTEAFVKPYRYATVGNTTYIAIRWVHPSCRDLTIDELSASVKYRKRFLDKCSYEGFLLAISIAGGAEGARAMPLVQDEDDWLKIEAVCKQVISVGKDVLKPLVANFSAAKEQNLDKAIGHSLERLIRRILPDVCAYHEQRGWSIDGVGALYKILELFLEAIAEPNLTTFVAGEVENLCDALDAYDDVWETATYIETFRDLVNVLDHRCSTQLSQPDVRDEIERGYKAIDAAMSRACMTVVDPTDHAGFGYKEAVSSYEDLQSSLQDLMTVSFGEQSKYSSFEDASTEFNSRIETLRDALAEEEEDDDRSDAQQVAEEIDIEELFKDL